MSPKYRKGVVEAFDVPTDPEFECLYGKHEADFDSTSMPPLWRQAINFAHSGKEFVLAASSSGKVLVKEAVREKRFKTCTGDKDTPKCFRYVPNRERCTGCGCNMPFKTWLAGMKCPEGKWEDDS